MNLPVGPLKVSIVVIVYEMTAQMENTLCSRLPPYQRELAAADYEIILIDNGSARVRDERLQKFSPRFLLER